MSRRPTTSRLLLAAVLAAPMHAASGCTTLGGNVKGSFACQAPDGICAPSTVIDDRALAMISTGAGDAALTASPSSAPMTTSRVRPSATARAAQAAVPAPRTRDKVLRIVLRPYVDEEGRLHEASAVQAVVPAERQTSAFADASLAPAGASPAAPDSRIQVGEPDGEASAADRTALDPNLPNAAVVAAARAHAVDPRAAIRAAVAARLASRPRETGTGAGARNAISEAGTSARMSTAPTPSAASAPARVGPIATGTPAPTSAAAASQMDPDARDRTSVEGGERPGQAFARDRAAAAAEPPPASAPDMRASSFPSFVPEGR